MESLKSSKIIKELEEIGELKFIFEQMLQVIQDCDRSLAVARKKLENGPRNGINCA